MEKWLVPRVWRLIRKIRGSTAETKRGLTAKAQRSDSAIDAGPFPLFLCVHFAFFAPLRFENSSRGARIALSSNPEHLDASNCA
jgi:hypothetical protein